jgi:hypothetical protein
LLEINGIGPAKLARFGHTLLEIIGEYAAALPSPDQPSVGARRGAGGEGSEEFHHDETIHSEKILVESLEPQPKGQAPRLADQSPASQPSYYWTWRLLSTGYPPDECAAIRGITRQTVLAHVLQALAGGLEIRPEWIISKELLAHLQSLPPKILAGDLAALLQKLPVDTQREEVAIYRKLILSEK